MDRKINPMEAWEDFYKWIRTRPEWRNLPAKERKAIYDAQSDYKGTRGKQLGAGRIRRLLNTYAPDRYEFRDVAFKTKSLK